MATRAKYQFPMFHLQIRSTGSVLVYRPEPGTDVRLPLFYLASDAELFALRHNRDCVVIPVSSPKMLYWLLVNPPGVDPSSFGYIVFDPVDVETDDTELVPCAEMIARTEPWKDHHY